MITNLLLTLVLTTTTGIWVTGHLTLKQLRLMRQDSAGRFDDALADLDLSLAAELFSQSHPAADPEA